jgi:FkbM family methyltransferase
MNVLFVMRHSGYVRNFESTVRLLCERGHRVHVAFQGRTKHASLDPGDVAAQLDAELDRFSYGDAPPREDGWGLLGRETRLGLDYLRYLGREYDRAPKLRERATWTAPPAVLAKTKRGFGATAVGRRLAATRLRMMNEAIPTDAGIDEYMDAVRPDVLAVTPLVEPGSPQSDYVRSARALGVRTVYCVASWDNLTNKGLIHDPLDCVTVWNDAMKDEAIRLHGIAASRVVVTGAAAFDHWFDWRPGTTRDEFCACVGLPSAVPYVLYVCSSKFVAPDEVSFVRTWLGRLRASAGALRHAGVLVRPHPQNAEQWQGVDFEGLGPVVIWPRAGAAPADARTRGDYFDSIFHSAAVVGINTTAEVESAIVGRPIHTVLTPEFQGTQEGTLHFRHLREVGGGVLHVTSDFPDHIVQLEAALANPGADAARCRAFVERFVRPHGIHVPAAPRLVDVFERLAARPPIAVQPPRWTRWLRRRLASRAEELARDTPIKRKAKTVTFRGSGAKEARTKAERGIRRRRMADMVRDFGQMGVLDRRSVVHDILEQIPPESFVELYTANKPRRLDYESADIYLRVTTKTESYRVNACAKEPFTIEWINARIGAGDVLYDIGANVGAYSLVAAKKPGGGARVYSFEASYVNVAALSVNVALNGLGGVVTPMPIALSDRTGMDVFNLRDIEAGGARHALGTGVAPEDGPTMFPQPVLVFRLDDLVEQFRLPPPNHIKLDVDGGELAVLNGAARTLASPALQSVLVEVEASLSDAVTEAFARSGLRLEARIAKQNKAGEYAVWYGVFTRGGDPHAPVVLTEHRKR